MIASRVLLFVYISLITGACAFAPRSRKSFSASSLCIGRRSSSPVQAYNNNNNNNSFDMSKPVFDLFSLRTIRGDALLRYNTLNQSEPLRINLYALLAVTLLSAPLISESVSGEAINTVQTIASAMGGALSTGLFVRECQKRSNQLNRMEKELNAQNLQIRISANVWSDRAYEKPQSLLQLRQSSNPSRILALSGTVAELNTAVTSLRVLGRRLQQSSTHVVLIPKDDSPHLNSFTASWLAEPDNPDEWKEYFNELAPTNEFRWFGLNFNGRSFGSGSGEYPQWLELLGQYLRPTELLDDADVDITDNADSASVLQAQKAFYAALTSGDLEAMNAILGSSGLSEQVTDVISAGGRLDAWKDCLMDGARPEGMRISGGDACILSDTEAYSTVIEFPVNTGIDTATLLAVQKWVRSSKAEEWKLQLHQTIPWSRESRAQGTLRCDCRGCVALTRSSTERSTFGGLIG